MRFPGVRPPKPLLPLETERRLTRRQRVLLDQLEDLLSGEELANLTMAKIAARVNCSLRTLYGIAPTRDELMLTVVDRRLHQVGRAAMELLDASISPLAALRVYLPAINEALQPTSVAFARAFARVPGAKRLLDAHQGYVIAVTQSLLERAAAQGEIEAVDTASVAHVLGSLGRGFARPKVSAVVAASPRATADAITEILLRGLATARGQRP